MSTPTSTAEELVAAAQAGQPEAFAELYRSYRDTVIGYLVRHLPRRDDAEDLAQEVFLRLPSLIGDYHPRQGGAFIAWLTGKVARFVLIDYGRYRWRYLSVLDAQRDALGVAVQGNEPEPDESAAPVSAALAAALERLSPAQRRCVQLRYLDGLPVSTTAALLGRSRKTVQWTCGEAIKRLRAELHPSVPPAATTATTQVSPVADDDAEPPASATTATHQRPRGPGRPLATAGGEVAAW